MVDCATIYRQATCFIHQNVTGGFITNSNLCRQTFMAWSKEKCAPTQTSQFQKCIANSKCRLLVSPKTINIALGTKWSCYSFGTSNSHETTYMKWLTFNRQRGNKKQLHFFKYIFNSFTHIDIYKTFCLYSSSKTSKGFYRLWLLMRDLLQNLLLVLIKFLSIEVYTDCWARFGFFSCPH